MSTDEEDIAHIHAQDVAAVRVLLQEAVREAGARWLPVNAIADAMMIELVVLQGRTPRVFLEARGDQARTATSAVWRAARRS